MTEEKKSEVIAEVKDSPWFIPVYLIFLKYSENLDMWLFLYPFIIQKQQQQQQQKHLFSFCYVSNIAQSAGNTEKNTQFLPSMTSQPGVGDINRKLHSITMCLEQELLRGGKVK